MNISAMTLDEVRDKLAELREWKRGLIDDPSTQGVSPSWTKGPPGGPKYLLYNNHPIPNTLDEAAKLPEGWHPEITDCTTRGGKPIHPWIAHATNEDTQVVMYCHGPIELEARFRLRLACELAEKEAP